MSSKYQVKINLKIQNTEDYNKKLKLYLKSKKLEKYFYKFIFQVIDGAFKC